MKNITMQKVVYVSNTTLIPYTIKYKELEKELEHDRQIEVECPKGMYDKRIKQIEKLGFKLEKWEWIPTENDPIWSHYKGIFTR